MAELIVFGLGSAGVNVDSSPLHLEENELRKAQNAHPNVAGADKGISSRPGLIQFSEGGTGAILGGIGVPLLNLFNGTHYLYLGRGTK